MAKNSQQNTFFWLRNFLILGQVLLWVMASTVWNIDYPSKVLVLSGFYFAMNIFSWLFRSSFTDRQIFINLLIDVTELSFFFYLTGGASNPFTWFLIVPIIFSATVLAQRYTWVITAYSILSYTLLIKFFKPVEMSMGSMQGMNHSMDHSTSFGQHLIGMWLGFIVLSVLISWVISGLMKNIRRKESLLLQANAKQAENEKILALATLATGSAHELGTPLATINILIREMLNDDTLSKQHKMLAIMESQVYRCKESLTQITASTGTTQAISGMVVSVNEFLGKVQTRLIDPDSQKLKLKTTHKNDDKLHIDKTLVQALVNIINNALESQATQVQIKTSVYARVLVLQIIDNGEGLSFDFGTKKPSEKEFGMGLGLFLAKTTIERFAGTIKIAKTDNSGTQLQIELPLVEHG
ncbi:MAG: ATP-binding protein [Proteobacteria bacterium]|nr:ATP-binding protein [Pseudomonadota bacterium]